MKFPFYVWALRALSLLRSACIATIPFCRCSLRSLRRRTPRPTFFMQSYTYPCISNQCEHDCSGSIISKRHPSCRKVGQAMPGAGRCAWFLFLQRFISLHSFVVRRFCPPHCYHVGFFYPSPHFLRLSPTLFGALASHNHARSCILYLLLCVFIDTLPIGIPWMRPPVFLCI